MIRARIREIEGQPLRIACLNHPRTGGFSDGYLYQKIAGVVFDAEQPDLCEDEEFNTLIRLEDGRLLWVQSIDLEFEPFQ